MKKRRKILVPIFIFIVVIFILKIMPKTGIFTYLFDNDNYSDNYPPPNQAISDLNELTPKTRKKAYKFLERCEEEGLDVIITETYRTKERQDYLYSLGREVDGNIVTWTKNSRHTDRYAFDICKNGADPYGDTEFFKRCAEIGREVGLNPGYYWENYQDMPHYQYDTWWNR